MGAKNRVSDTFVFYPFKDLGKIIERKKGKLSAQKTLTKKNKAATAEEMFINAMREVREIKEFRKIPVKQEKPVTAHRKNSPDNEALKILKEIVKGRKPINLADTQEYVEWINHDFRVNITKELHKGRYSVQDTLDLHGITVEGAEAEIDRFLKGSFKKGYRCIKIIHGRGLRSPRGPVLKEAVIKWLTGRYRKNIKAFVTARQCDGGLGALYVVL